MDENAKFRSFEEMNEAAARGEVTEAEAKMFIMNYGKAYAEEFEVKQAAAANGSSTTSASSDERISTVRQLFKDNAIDAANQVIFLMNHAESESVQLNASKFVIAEAKEDSGTASEMDKLFEQLTKQSS